jgi:hypothetical protein
VLAYDLLRLSHWFDDVDASASTHGWGSLEPDLALDSLGWFHGKVAIAANLSYGLSDPSRRETGEHGRDLVIVWLSAEETAAARVAIAEVLRHFPPRGEHGQTQLVRVNDARSAALKWRSRWGRASSGKDTGLGALTDAERELLRRCLVAVIDSPFFGQGKLRSLFGLDREQMVAVVSRWSELEYLDPIAGAAINGTLTYLVGYPNARDADWASFIDAPRSEVARVYRKFLGEPPRDS